MSERTRDERIEMYYDESAQSLAEWLVDAEDEAARLRREVAATHDDADYYQEWAHANGHRLNAMIRCRDRYRSAWLSARRRAVDEYNHTAEALALRDAEIARLIAEPRKSTHAAELECMGAEEDGSTVWRLAH